MKVEASVRVLALASAGGHWVQLRRLRPAWAGCDIAYATSHSGYRSEVERDAETGRVTPRFYTFPEASRWNRLRLLWQCLAVARIVWKERPQVVISTGASAGYFALRISGWLGARTIWVDSIANADELSLSGRRAGRYADLWLTQWPELAEGSDGTQRTPQYFGSVI